MRRLWITRHKAMAASGAKMKVYIEDYENGDTYIQNTLCRKLGVLKNNQKKHFAIGEEAARVYVAADKLSRDAFCEFVTIPEGQEDVFLSGRNHFQPFAGNPFRFDGVEDAETLENRKRGNKRGKGLLIAAIIVGILAGAGIGVAVSASLLKKTPVREAALYSCRGMQIVMDESFAEQSAPGFAASFVNAETAVRVMREDFSLQEGLEGLTLEEYKDQIFANNGFEASFLREQEADRICFAYTWSDPGTGDRYAFYNVLMKGPDAFWLVQFSAPQEDAADREPVFRQWAGTITFTDR